MVILQAISATCQLANSSENLVTSAQFLVSLVTSESKFRAVVGTLKSYPEAKAFSSVLSQQLLMQNLYNFFCLTCAQREVNDKNLKTASLCLALLKFCSHR